MGLDQTGLAWGGLGSRVSTMSVLGDWAPARTGPCSARPGSDLSPENF